MKNFQNFLFGALILVPALYCSQNTKNPLADTQWKGIGNIPTPEEVVFRFGKDTLDLIYQETVVEKMKYSFTDQGSLKLVKTEGISPCSTEVEGLYQYKIEKDTLKFIIINDDCLERQMAFDGNGYKKILPIMTN